MIQVRNGSRPGLGWSNEKRRERQDGASKRYLAGAALLALFVGTDGPVMAGPSVLGSPIHDQRFEITKTPTSPWVQVQQNNRARDQAVFLRLEEEIRRLNGRLEELEYKQRQTENRLNELIEQQAAVPEITQGDATGDTPEAIDQQASRAPDQVLDDLVQQIPSPPPEGGLGRVPESAVANLPRPNLNDIAAPARQSLSAEEQYENAVKLLRAGNYRGAQDGLEVFLELHETHQLASNAAYWLAETHYVRQNYAAAAAAFARNYGTYGKEAPKAVDNLLKLGMSLNSLGESDKACLSYLELSNNFPNPPAQIAQALNRERARAQCS